jgi:hypothetical protein
VPDKINLGLFRLRRHDVGLLERGQIDHRVFQLAQLLQANFGGMAGHLRGGTETALGQAPLNRHLAAFESDLVIAAGARSLALVALAAGLAETRTAAAAETLGRRLAPRPGFMVFSCMVIPARISPYRRLC